MRQTNFILVSFLARASRLEEKREKREEEEEEEEEERNKKKEKNKGMFSCMGSSVF